MTLDDLRNRRIGVLGFDTNNRGVTEWLLRHGIGTVSVLDEGAVEWRAGQAKDLVSGRLPDPSVSAHEWRLGPEAFSKLEDFDVLIRTPGVRLDRTELIEARQRGTAIISQTKLFFSLCPAPIIGVTGTKGKGTTASLIAAMIQSDKERVGTCYLAGNIGLDPFTFLDELTKNDVVVLELSSFQLQDLDTSPRGAVVLGITSDHLDYHGTTEEYVAAKMPIVRYQTPGDFAVVNIDSPASAAFRAQSRAEVWEISRQTEVDRGVFLRRSESSPEPVSGHIVLRDPKHGEVEVLNVHELQLRGEHNIDNVAAAVATSYVAGVPMSAIRSALRSFSGYEHRLQFVGTAHGIAFYNDSAATSPEPATAAVKSFQEPVHLIVGGAKKAPDFSQFAHAIIESPVVTVTPLGNAEAPKIVSAIEQARSGNPQPVILPTVFTMSAAIDSAMSHAKSGDVVLLSPAATGFDLFDSYVERGNQFCAIVQQLQSEGSAHGA